jgi:hypothetical protein
MATLVALCIGIARDFCHSARRQHQEDLSLLNSFALLSANVETTAIHYGYTSAHWVHKIWVTVGRGGGNLQKI